MDKNIVLQLVCTFAELMSNSLLAWSHVFDILSVKVETREDEEQNVKMAETVELLLAAGYFRARIKGLSPFDKVHVHCTCIDKIQLTCK